jgi:D-alanyl-D-alanine carboxypeptidase
MRYKAARTKLRPGLQAMFTRMRILLSAACSVLVLVVGAAAAAKPDADVTTAEPPFVRGPYLVLDAENGRVFDQYDAMRPWYPASTTKLMTLYTVFRAIEAGETSLATDVIYSRTAANQPPSKMGFKPGTTFALEDGLKMMMVKSANDVAVAVAETVGGSVAGFAERMNREAERLGMSRSHFVNPHGLPDERQVTTAKDMAIVARALLRDFPERRAYLGLHAIEFGGKTIRNYNTLLRRYQGATGMKTGFICASGYNLVASARRGEREVIAVVFGEFGGNARAEHAASLLEEGLRADPATPGDTLVTTWSGKDYTAPLDMRPYVCGGQRLAAASEANEEGGEAESVSRLTAPLDLGPPIKVAVKVPPEYGEAGFVARVPRPRPPQESDAPETGVAFAPVEEPAAGSPPAAAIGEAAGSAVPLKNLPAVH